MLGAVRYIVLCACLLFVVIFADVNVDKSKLSEPYNRSARLPLWNSTQTDKLKRALLLNYDKYARPSQHYNVTTVTLSIRFIHFELDDMKSMFGVTCWMYMQWEDEKMKWNSSDFGGLEVLRLAEHEIWKPDLVLYNSASGKVIDHYGNTHFVVYESGKVIWVPPTQFVAFCEVNLRDWPFDVQQCSLKLGSWTYDGNKVDIQLENTEKELEEYINSNEWIFDSFTKERNVVLYSCCEEPYIDVTYNITLSRRSSIYQYVVINPAVVVIFITLSTFWISPFSSMKIVVNACALIVISIFMLFFTQRLPAMAMDTPRVVLFYRDCLYMAMFSMIIAVVVKQLTRGRKTSPLPQIFKTTMYKLERFLCLTLESPDSAVNGEELREQGAGGSNGGGAVATVDEQNTSDDHQILASTQIKSTKSAASIQTDWLHFATAVDRMCFVCYMIVYIVLLIVYTM